MEMQGKGSWIKDISLAEWGRKEMNISELEMPGIVIKNIYRANGMQKGIWRSAASKGSKNYG